MKAKPKRNKRNASHSRWLNAGISLAHKYKVYLVEEGQADDPEWRIYSLHDGKAIIWYAPASGRYKLLGRFGQETGTNSQFDFIFQLAQSRNEEFAKNGVDTPHVGGL